MKTQLLLPLALTSQLLFSAPPRVTPEELAAFERLVAPRIIPDHGGDSDHAKADLRNQKVTLGLAQFAETFEVTTLISQTDEEVADAAEEEDPLKDLFKPGPESLVIQCSKGIYLDGEAREIVYLGKINIQGQGLTMTCNKDLKAIFAAPPVPEKKDDQKEEDDEPLAKFTGFGELEQFTASGDVRLSGVNVEGQTFYLGGDRALYQMETVDNVVQSSVNFAGEKIAIKLVNPNTKTGKGSTMAMRSVSKDSWLKAIVKGDKIFVEWSPNGWETHLDIPAGEKKK